MSAVGTEKRAHWGIPASTGDAATAINESVVQTNATIRSCLIAAPTALLHGRVPREIPVVVHRAAATTLPPRNAALRGHVARGKLVANMDVAAPASDAAPTDTALPPKRQQLYLLSRTQPLQSQFRPSSPTIRLRETMMEVRAVAFPVPTARLLQRASVVIAP